MTARLLWRDGQGHEGTVDISLLEVYVGRAVECAIRTDDPMVSRRHARIFFREGMHIIEDLGSANGMFVDENRVRMHTLRHGDAVRLGNLWVRYVNEGPQGYPAPSVAPNVQPSGPPPPMYAAPQPAPMQYGAPPPAAPAYGNPPPRAPAPAPPPAPRASEAMPAGGAPASGDVARLQRRVEQLQTEVRLLRGGGDKAITMEQLEAKVAALTDERDKLAARVGEVEGHIAADGGDVRVQRAGLVLKQAEEAVNGLNDVLSEIRINLMAAQAEVESWANQLPRAQFELVRESLRTCLQQMENAKAIIHQLQSAGSRR